MKKIYNAALAYLIAGLIAGIFYREITKAFNFTGITQLSVLHTHLLTLGMLFFLILIPIEKTFSLTRSRWFTAFFWTYWRHLDHRFYGRPWHINRSEPECRSGSFRTCRNGAHHPYSRSGPILYCSERPYFRKRKTELISLDCSISFRLYM